MEQFARYLYLWNPQVSVTVADPKPSSFSGLLEVVVTAAASGITEPHTFYVTPDGQRIIEGSTYHAQNPFADNQARIKTDLQPSQGTPGAPIVLVLYSDFQCGYCRQTAKTLHDNLLKTYPQEVRLYFKDFPLDAIHPWARPAALAGRCVFRQNPQAFWDYHDWLFDKQAEVTPENLRTKIMEWAGTKGLDTMQLGRCFDSRATEKEVDRSVTEARELRVDSTPTLFLNGRKLPGSMPWTNLKAVIDFELDHQKRTGIAGGEKCCELRVSPLPAQRN